MIKLSALVPDTPTQPKLIDRTDTMNMLTSAEEQTWLPYYLTKK